MVLLEKKVRTEGNIELRIEMILTQEYQSGTQPTPVDITREPNIDCRWVSRVIDQDIYRFEHWKAHAPFKRVTVKFYLENVTTCIL